MIKVEKQNEKEIHIQLDGDTYSLICEVFALLERLSTNHVMVYKAAVLAHLASQGADLSDLKHTD